ncbi:MAG: RDD family protein [Gammaproteobacteria bacterium]
MNAALAVCPAGLPRRLAALVYDALLVFGLLFAATALLLPFTHGEAIRPGHYEYTFYLVLVCFLFYGWCWTHGGQTLGMQAWKIRAQARDGTAITWTQAGARFCAAILSWLPLGLGYWWMLIDRERLTWHDRMSSTVVVDTRGNG